MTKQYQQQHEINKFNDRAHEWWSIDGEFKTLHQINPIRLDFIKQHAILNNKKVIDVGCGGGILTESLAQENAIVTGIDLAPQVIEIAKLHLYESELNINYECTDIESFANKHANEFNILSCMEMLEHVPIAEEVIANCAKLLKPNGIAFFSTLNRTLKSYALGVIAAEYIFQLLPKGTHDYAKFIKPSELHRILNKHGLNVTEIKGLNYNPFTGKASISNDVSINYMVSCVKI